MINSRFREVVWTGGICAAALAFYMVSQTVAAKRAELSGVERKIAATNQEIRQLRTEIDTRGGLAQIESWNATVYGLQAPGAEQFVSSSIKLVALTQPQPRTPALPLDPAIVASHGAVSQVSLNRIEDSGMGAPTPRSATAAPPPVAQPALRQANYVQAKPSALAPAAPSPVQEVALRKTARPAALGDDFLADLGDEGTASRSRKVKP
ncbi:MAG: hypothetical protein ABW128_02680 [Rhizorhabdus sp.]